MSDRIHDNGEEKATDFALHFDEAEVIEEIKREAAEHGSNTQNVNLGKLVRDILAYAKEHLQDLQKIASAYDVRPTLRGFKRAGAFGNRVAHYAERHDCSEGGYSKAAIGAAVAQEVQSAVLARFIAGELGDDNEFLKMDTLALIAVKVIGRATNRFGLGPKISPDIVDRAAEVRAELLHARTLLPLDVIKHLTKTKEGRAILERHGSKSSTTQSLPVRGQFSAQDTTEGPTPLTPADPLGVAKQDQNFGARQPNL